jgi:hypothetical protein
LSEELDGFISIGTKQRLSVVKSWTAGAEDRIFSAQEAVAVGLADRFAETFTADQAPAVTATGTEAPTEDEVAWQKWLANWPAVTVRDRERFLRSMSAWLVHKVRT